MKKRLFLALSAGLLLTGMTACTGGGKQGETSGTEGGQSQTEAAASETGEKTADEIEFTAGKGNVGSVEIGMAVSKMPEQVEGLYDKFEKKTEILEECDDEWTVEYLLCTRAGTPVLRVNVYDDILTSISLLEGATNVKTPDGIRVGFSARELFQKKKMQWENWFDGFVHGNDGTYCYTVEADGLQDVDIPEKASDFKEDATVCKITLNNE